MAKKPNHGYTKRGPRVKVGARTMRGGKAASASAGGVTLTVGPKKRSAYNLRDFVTGARDAQGRFMPNVTGNDVRFRVPEAVRWPSVGRYHDAVKEDGLDQFAADLSKYTVGLGVAAVDVMAAALEPTMRLSRYYCPKDTTTLVKSAYLDVVRAPDGSRRVEMGYARNGRPFYAAFVHEIAKYHHDSPTSYKYLTRALREDWGKVKERFTKGMQKVAVP